MIASFRPARSSSAGRRAGTWAHRHLGPAALLVLGLVLLLALASPAAGAGGAGTARRSRHHRRHHRRHRRPPTCSGTAEHPGVLAGEYKGEATVGGYCVVDRGLALIDGNLTLLPGSTLVADYALDDLTHAGESILAVEHDLIVDAGATALLGCEPTHFVCADDPNQNPGTLSNKISIAGDLIEHEPLGVVVHHADISGSVTETGGGGVQCKSVGAFQAVHFPVYSDYEDTGIGGNLTITGMRGCWLGIARVEVNGNVSIVDDQMEDEDAIEILSDDIGGNLLCVGNRTVWDDEGDGEAQWPRIPYPDDVHGTRSGQCLVSSPTEPGGASGPGAF